VDSTGQEAPSGLGDYQSSGTIGAGGFQRSRGPIGRRRLPVIRHHHAGEELPRGTICVGGDYNDMVITLREMGLELLLAIWFFCVSGSKGACYQMVLMCKWLCYLDGELVATHAPMGLPTVVRFTHEPLWSMFNVTKGPLPLLPKTRLQHLHPPTHPPFHSLPSQRTNRYTQVLMSVGWLGWSSGHRGPLVGYTPNLAIRHLGGRKGRKTEM
jgi:hypothetical protein